MSDSVPDLTLLVGHDVKNGETQLRFQLESRDCLPDANRNEFGPVVLRGSQPHEFLENHLRALEELPLVRKSDPAMAQRLVENKGASLFRELLPADLQEVLWNLIPQVDTLAIVSDEPWIPWELLRFHEGQYDARTRGPFFGETFALSRWLRGIAAHRHLPVHHLALVVSAAEELETKAERKIIQEVGGPTHRVTEIPARYMDLTDALASGDYDAFHFAGHGWTHCDPAGSGLALDNNEKLQLEDIEGATHGLEHSSPLIFLNACQTGQSGMSLTRVDGWAQRFLRAGAGAFLGALWSIDGSYALKFAAKFYQGFLSGHPIAKAVQDARLALQRELPGDPTSLAYTVFAHPLASVKEGAQRVPRKTLPPHRVKFRPARKRTLGDSTPPGRRTLVSAPRALSRPRGRSPVLIVASLLALGLVLLLDDVHRQPLPFLFSAGSSKGPTVPPANRDGTNHLARNSQSGTTQHPHFRVSGDSDSLPGFTMYLNDFANRDVPANTGDWTVEVVLGRSELTSFLEADSPWHSCHVSARAELTRRAEQVDLGQLAAKRANAVESAACRRAGEALAQAIVTRLARTLTEEAQ